MCQINTAKAKTRMGHLTVVGKSELNFVYVIDIRKGHFLQECHAETVKASKIPHFLYPDFMQQLLDTLCLLRLEQKSWYF